MKYPAILKNTIGGQTVLAVSGKLFIHMSGEFEMEDSESYSFDSRYKNITTEYLANTYGEIKSKEHAEFIVELAEVNGFHCVDEYCSNSKYFNFYEGVLSFWEKESTCKINGHKKITIPLPPECEEKIYRYEGMGQKPKHFDCVCTKCGGRCCIGSCDDWPKVGDGVVTNSGKGVVKLPPDNSGFYVVSVAGEYLTLKITAIQKPKTPEQELREFLHLLWRENNEDFDDFVDIAILHLKKKGEGDE